MEYFACRAYDLKTLIAALRHSTGALTRSMFWAGSIAAWIKTATGIKTGSKRLDGHGINIT